MIRLRIIQKAQNLHCWQGFRNERKHVVESWRTVIKRVINKKELLKWMYQLNMHLRESCMDVLVCSQCLHGKQSIQTSGMFGLQQIPTSTRTVQITCYNDSGTYKVKVNTMEGASPSHGSTQQNFPLYGHVQPCY